MGFFSDFVSKIQEKFAEKQRQKKEEQDFIRRLELQAQVEQRQIFAEEYKRNAKTVAIAKAKRDAAQKSGLQKMRAEERVKRLQEQGIEPGSFFDKLNQYTQKNLAKREENLKRTAEARESARKIREERLQNQQKGRKPFGRTW